MPDVKPVADGEGWYIDGASYNVDVGVITVFIVPDEKCANQIARILNMARESLSHHNAMQLLTEQLFLQEDTAKIILHNLHAATQPIEVQRGKPN